jgi:hypothetical protein
MPRPLATSTPRHILNLPLNLPDHRADAPLARACHPTLPSRSHAPTQCNSVQSLGDANDVLYMLHLGAVHEVYP